MSLPINIKLTVPLFLSFSLLAACGGGGGFSGDTASSTESTTGTTTDDTTAGNTGSSTVSTIRLTASSRQLPSDGSQPIIISAVAKDSSNELLEDAGIDLAVNNEADLPKETGVTYVTSELTPGVPINRKLTVTATAGSVSESIIVDVVGTTVTLSGPSRIAIDSTVDYTLKAADSGNNAIAHQVVSLPTVNSGESFCTIVPPPAEEKVNGEYQTDANGEFIYQVSGKAGGDCEIVVNAFGEEAKKDIVVSGEEFEIKQENGDEIDIDKTIEVDLASKKTFLLSFKNDKLAQADETITISSTRGVLTKTGSDEVITSVKTNDEGKAKFDISSSRAGSVVITATTRAGLTDVLDNLEFVATEAAYLVTQAEPSLIQASESSTIVSKVRDLRDNPVKGQRVLFTIEDVVDGGLSSSEATTDSLGRASVVYTAGNTTSEKDGVKIITKLADDDGIEEIVNDTDGSNTILTTLTVGGGARRIVLGGDNLISPNGVFYKKDFGVIVTDNAGNPIKNQKVDFKVNPIRYFKGEMVQVDSDGDGENDKWEENYAASGGCPVEDLDYDGASDDVIDEDLNKNGVLDVINEDLNNDGIFDISTEDLNGNGEWDKDEDTNRNGTLEDGEDANGNGLLDTDEDKNGNYILDDGEDLNNNGLLDTNEDVNNNGVLDVFAILSDAEDINHNGKLDPTNAAAVLTGTGETGDDGSLTISIQYNKSEALWSAQRLTATIFVEGSEYIEQAEFKLPVLADDVSDVSIAPPNKTSPYGLDAACTSPY